MNLTVTPLVIGTAEGEVLVMGEPISFWGGVDMCSGRVTDRNHPQHGITVTRTVLLLPYSKGSSSSTSVLAEMVRTGVAPAGMVMAAPDPIVVLAAVVAHELYGLTLPVVVADPKAFDTISGMRRVTIQGAQVSGDDDS